MTTDYYGSSETLENMHDVYDSPAPEENGSIYHSSSSSTMALSQNLLKSMDALKMGVVSNDDSEIKIFENITAYFEKHNRHGMRDMYLKEALQDLSDLGADAEEANLPPPSPIAVRTANYLVRKFIDAMPQSYYFSLWKDGDVIIYSTNKGHRANIYCRANGGVSLYVNGPDNGNYESHYQIADNMPLESVIEALRNIPE